MYNRFLLKHNSFLWRFLSRYFKRSCFSLTFMSQAKRLCPKLNVFSSEILPVSCLEYQYICFSSDFCCLVFVVLFVLMWSYIFNIGKCSSSVFSWHIESVYFISRMYGFVRRRHLSCPLVQLPEFFACFFFKDSPKYLIKSITLVFIPLVIFLLKSLVSRSFLIFLLLFDGVRF